MLLYLAENFAEMFIATSSDCLIYLIKYYRWISVEFLDDLSLRTKKNLL